MTELETRGVAFGGEVADAGFGLAARLETPDGVRAPLYPPRQCRGAG